MATRANILRSLIDEIEWFQSRVAVLTRRNEATVIVTRAHLNDTEAQITRRSKDPDRLLRENGSFLP